MSVSYGNPPPLARPELPALTLRTDPPRILMLYGSLRERSYSRLLAEEAGRVLTDLGCDPAIAAKVLSSVVPGRPGK